MRKKPNKNQGPKAHQEDRKARKVQRKNIDLPQNTVLRQIKTNWAQGPFDPVIIIWPTKAQILLYKKIGVKVNMKKDNEKKQGIVGSVRSRNHTKERKAKPKENDKHSMKRMKK